MWRIGSESSSDKNGGHRRLKKNDEKIQRIKHRIILKDKVLIPAFGHGII